MTASNEIEAIRSAPERRESSARRGAEAEAVGEALIALTREDDLARPMCVDLEGALLRGYSVWEGVLRLVREKPSIVLVLPLWLLRGPAWSARAVAERIPLDPAPLPYRTDLVQAMR